MTRIRTFELAPRSPTVPLIVIVSPLVKLEPFRVAVSPPSDCTYCCGGACALIIVKLEAKRMRAMAKVSPIAGTFEIDNEKDFLTVSRRRERLLNKLRLLRDYSIKSISRQKANENNSE